MPSALTSRVRALGKPGGHHCSSRIRLCLWAAPQGLRAQPSPAHLLQVCEGDGVAGEHLVRLVRQGRQQGELLPVRQVAAEHGQACAARGEQPTSGPCQDMATPRGWVLHPQAPSTPRGEGGSTAAALTASSPLHSLQQRTREPPALPQRQLSSRSSHIQPPTICPKGWLNTGALCPGLCCLHCHGPSLCRLHSAL